jgi:pimeloyl-ACP methyl ester carboxylesterase
MTIAHVNGADLFYEVSGEGDPLVLVHGSWGDHNNWAAVVPALAESYRVITYDRRGHSQSSGSGTTADDVDDLAALIETLAGGTAHVAGNSFGAIVTLKCAITHPEVFRTLSAHEPPLFGLIRSQPEYESIAGRIKAVVAILERGDMEAGARTFVETIAFGPGAWDTLPEPVRTTFVSNAGTWLDENKDAGWDDIDLDALSRFPKRALLSQGDQSAPEFAPVVGKVRAALGAEHHVFAGAGHVPHVTHPADYVARLREFVSRA